MLRRVHIFMGLFLALYFLPHVNHKILFFPIVLISSIIPDLDTIFFPHKTHYKIIKMLKSEPYKNFMHSYTLCIFLSLILAFFYPIIALPFFIGYSFHLFFESLTTYGTRPFWPAKIRSKGFIAPEGTIEKTLTVILGILSVILILGYLI
ncbi:metal-dependent hydrolase [Patescibacteria group bacterium]|nr:metal-dependent hydrolase [Patescibacteria group bacterium]